MLPSTGQLCSRTRSRRLSHPYAAGTIYGVRTFTQNVWRRYNKDKAQVFDDVSTRKTSRPLKNAIDLYTLSPLTHHGLVGHLPFAFADTNDHSVPIPDGLTPKPSNAVLLALWQYIQQNTKKANIPEVSQQIRAFPFSIIP